ncbi:MAG: 30S ribosomal protein S18 [Candidatus Pacebacteria bacterium]|nr:30S ribosomal protein S18 [Candidatus Paceibacterota bacterium]
MAKQSTKINPDEISYKNVELLSKMVSRQGTILPRSKTGLSQKHQRRLAKAVKRARHLALIQFTQTV